MAQMLVGRVTSTYHKDHPGQICVQVFNEINANKDKNSSLWVSYLYNVDINGMGLHSVPQKGDAVVLLQYGTAASEWFAVGNFWRADNSPYECDETGNYGISYSAIDTTKISEKMNINDLANEKNFLKLREVKTAKKSNAANHQDVNILENVRAFNTKYFQFLIDETDDKNPTAIATNNDRSTIIQLSPEGVFMFDTKAISIFSGHELQLAAAEKVTMLSNEINVQTKCNIGMTAEGNIELNSKKKIKANGEEILLNCKGSSSSSNVQVQQGIVPVPLDLASTFLKVTATAPYFTAEGEIGPEFTLRNFDPNNINDNGQPVQVNSGDIPVNLGLKNDADKGAAFTFTNAAEAELIDFYNKLVKNLTFNISNKSDKGKNFTVIEVKLGLNTELFKAPIEVPGFDANNNYISTWEIGTPNNPYYSLFIKKGQKPSFRYSRENQQVTYRVPLQMCSVSGQINHKTDANAANSSMGCKITLNDQVFTDFIKNNKITAWTGTRTKMGDLKAYSLVNPLTIKPTDIYLNMIELQTADPTNPGGTYAVLGGGPSLNLDQGIDISVDIVAPNSVTWPKIQLVRRSTNIRLSEDKVEKIYELEIKANGEISPNTELDVSSHDNWTRYTTGDKQAQQNLFQQIKTTNDYQNMPARFSYFFDQHRVAGFDSLVHVHNLYKFAKTGEYDTMYHDIDAKGGITETFLPVMHGSPYIVYDKPDVAVPVVSDGKTLVIDVSDQFHRAALGAAIAAPLAALGTGIGLGSLINRGEIVNEDDPAFVINDVTSDYTQSFDSNVIGVRSNELNAKNSRYYYGTLLSVEGYFDKEKADTFKLLTQNFTFKVYSISNGRTTDITDSTKAIGKKYSYEKYNSASNTIKINVNELVEDKLHYLPIGTYMVSIVGEKNEKSSIVFEIVPAEVELVIRDATNHDDPSNKALLSNGFGTISNVDGGLYSRYRHGTHISLKAYFDIDVAHKLGGPGLIKQSISISLYNADDKALSKPLWTSETFEFDSRNDIPVIDLVDPDDKEKWLSFEYGDYLVVASGVITYGDVQQTIKSKLVMSLRNSLALYDESTKTEIGNPGDGLYQPVISLGEDISGPVVNQNADGSFYKGGTYFSEDFKNLAIWLKFSDKGEHEFTKKLIDVSTGLEVDCDIEDKYDAEIGGYRIGLKSEIPDGYYKLTIISKDSDDMKDDILFRLYGAAEIACTLYSRGFLTPTKHYENFSEFTGLMTYSAASIKDDAKVVSYAILYDPDGNIIKTIDGFASVMSGSESFFKKTDETYDCDAMSGLNVWLITPGKPVNYKVFAYDKLMGTIAKIDYVIMGVESIASFKVTISILDKTTGRPISRKSDSDESETNDNGSTSQNQGGNSSSQSGSQSQSSSSGSGNSSSSSGSDGSSGSSNGSNNSSSNNSSPDSNPDKTEAPKQNVKDDSKSSGQADKTASNKSRSGSKSTGGSTKKG